MCLCVCVQWYTTFWNPMDCSLPDSPSKGFPRQDYWNGLPFPPPGDLTNPGIEPRDRTHISCVSCIGRQIFYLRQSCDFTIILICFKTYEPPSILQPREYPRQEDNTGCLRSFKEWVLIFLKLCSNFKERVILAKLFSFETIVCHMFYSFQNRNILLT